MLNVELKYGKRLEFVRGMNVCNLQWKELRIFINANYFFLFPHHHSTGQSKICDFNHCNSKCEFFLWQ